MVDFRAKRCLAKLLFRAVFETVTGIVFAPVKHHLRLWKRGKRFSNETRCLNTEFNRFILASCPALQVYKPAPWAPGSASQTVYAAFVRTWKFCYIREMVRMPDDVSVALDWCPHSSSLQEDTPVILVLHGIGCSSEGTTPKLMMQHCIKHRLRGVVYNRRGHGGTSLVPGSNSSGVTKVWKPVPMHADIEDMEAVVLHIASKYPRAKIICVGFSLGSNLLLRYLGVMGSDSLVHAAVSVANGFDMVKGTRYLQKKNPVMDTIITGKMKNLLRSNSEQLIATKRIEEDRLEGVYKSKSLREFDELLVKPVYGFKDVDDYYSEHSCSSYLKDITCPVLCVGDKEDPLLTEELQNHALDASNDNPNIICTLTRTGGHLGWLEGWRGKSWSIKACGQYIEAVLEAEKLFRGGCSSPDSILGGQRLSLQL